MIEIQFPESGIYKVVGPPGTGKTYRNGLAAAHYSSVYPGEVMAVTLTNGAREEIKKAGVDLEYGCVATMHSHVMRSLGSKILKGEALADWNKAHPRFALTHAALGVEKPRDVRDPRHVPGSDLYDRVSMLIAKFIPMDEWHDPDNKYGHREKALPIHQEFWRTFSSFLDARNLTTFVHMMRKAYEDQVLPMIPLVDGSFTMPKVILVDEAQDLSRLEEEILYFWAKHVEVMYIVGDPYQRLFSFRGASCEILNEWNEVLTQGYRCPVSVVAPVARPIMRRIESLEDVIFEPTEVQGSVIKGPNRKQTWDLVRLIEDGLVTSQSVMAVATCKYILEPLADALEVKGIPYHNPYVSQAPGAGFSPFNPLPRSAARGIPMMERLRAFHDFGVTGEVTLEGLQMIAPLLKDAFIRGAKVRIERADETEPGKWFDQNADSIMKSDKDMLALCSGDLTCRWFFDHVIDRVRGKLAYIRAIVGRSGQASLFDTPRVVLSTIHSIKGASADRVLVFPDLSPAFYEQYTLGSVSERESIQMMMYVAVTRTRDTLILCSPFDSKRTQEW